MIITGKRIHTLKGRMDGFKRGGTIYLGARLVPSMMKKLTKAGFPNTLKDNDIVLPSAIGPVTKFNAEGRYDIVEPKKMEVAYTVVEWTWKEWDGTEHTDYFDRPYKRYVRKKVAPPGVELQVTFTADGQRAIATPALKYKSDDDTDVIHAVNLLLEILGECEIFTAEMGTVIKAPIRRLNWKILPSGKRTWKLMKPDLDAIIKMAKGGCQPVIEHRMETINSYGPDFVALGQAGFAGYVVFGFTPQKTFLMESIYTGNATYFFGERWESLSKLTKTQVLDDKLHEDRILHRETWPQSLKAALKAKGITGPNRN